MIIASPRADVPPREPPLPEIAELLATVRSLPASVRVPLEPAVAEVIEQSRFRGRVLDVAREALERLRLDLALMQFDLEITRKERDGLQRRLDDLVSAS